MSRSNASSRAAISGRTVSSSRRPSVAAASAAGASLALVLAGVSAGAAEGLVVPPAGAHDWTGAFNDRWNIGNNWNVGSVPGTGDSVIILGGPFNNVLLQGDTADLGSLFIGGAKSLTNFGHVIDVTNGAGATTVTGDDSSVFVVQTPGGGPGFRSTTMQLSNEAALLMSGGRARILDQLTFSSDARLAGHGRVEVFSSAPAAFNGLLGGPLLVSGGDLEIAISGGGSIALPASIVVNGHHELSVTGPLFSGLVDLTMADGGAIDIAQPWTIGGTVLADADVGEAAVVAGGPVTIDGVLHVDNDSTLLLQAPVLFGGGGTATLDPGATLEIEAADHDAEAGHHLLVSNGARLRLPVAQAASAWSGDITLAPNGVLEVANGIDPWWIDGTLEVNGFAALRGRIEGSRALRVITAMELTGSGAEIDGHLELLDGASMTLPGPGTRLVVDGTVELHVGSETIGDGGIDVRASGMLRLRTASDVHVDIANAGSLRLAPDGVPAYVYVHGDVEQSAGGDFRVAIGGLGGGDRDILETSGTVQLGGRLDVATIDGFVPTEGDAFEVIWANGGLIGTFDEITPGWQPAYDANRMSVVWVGTSCQGDLDGDGLVGLTDMLLVLADWDAGVSTPADLDGDGTVGIDDLLVVLANWGSCS